MNVPEIISVMYCLNTQQGHIYGYNRTFGEIVRSIGWTHTGWARAAAQVGPLPIGWRLCLGTADVSQSHISKFIALVRTQMRLLRAIRSDNPVLFLEWFDLVHLISLAIVLSLAKKPKNLRLWIMFRLGLHGARDKWTYLTMLRWYEALLGRTNVTLLSDSDKVAHNNEVMLNRPLHVLPIPHTAVPSDADIAAAQALRSNVTPKLIVCWWPGQPAAAKGLDVIRAIAASHAPEAEQIHLVFAESAEVVHIGRTRVQRVPNVLSHAEYAAWMAAADVILLPYDPAAYAERTSGIFTEAVAAGRMPFVSEGTWMAHELHRHGLPEFIVDWNRPDLIDYIVRTARDAAAQERLRRFGISYRAYHCEQSFSEKLATLWESQRSSH
jgi:hypothetical protein